MYSKKEKNNNGMKNSQGKYKDAYEHAATELRNNPKATTSTNDYASPYKGSSCYYSMDMKDDKTANNSGSNISLDSILSNDSSTKKSKK